jgi:hypothetical protein
MQFKLFDAASGGTRQGTTLTDVPVAVSTGIFSTQLNFGVFVYDYYNDEAKAVVAPMRFTVK